MEPTKSFTSVDEILELSHQIVSKHLHQVGLFKMRVTKERLDGWLTKGLDGLRDHFLNRSSQETPVPRLLLERLDLTIRMLEVCASDDHAASTEDTDEMLGKAAMTLVTLLYERVTKTPLGGLPVNNRADIKRLLMDLRLAQSRMKGNVDAKSP